jgi:hypothetical protein
MNIGERKQARQYSDKWQQRFDFFHIKGAPNSATHKPALQQLAFRQRIKIMFNIYALFFGPVYLFVLGLWKKNLTLLAIIFSTDLLLNLAFSAAGANLPAAIDWGLNFGFSMMYAVITNYAYFLKEQKGEQGWNPFKGMRW